MMERPQEMYDLQPAVKRRMRDAMLSVYYHSLGRQWQQQGAPAVLLPPDIRPLGLAEALDALKESPPRLEDAIWRIIRSVPVRQWADDPVENRYPEELGKYVRDGWLKEVDDLRRWYRTGANMYAAALDLLADGNVADAQSLAGMLAPGKEQRFNAAVGNVFGQFKFVTSFDQLTDKANRAVTEARAHLDKLENRVGSSVRAFVMNFADAAAFNDAGSPLTSGGSGRSGGPTGLDIKPVSTVVVQDTTSLSTTATVTTIVNGPIELVGWVVDPRSWPDSSDVITHTDYVADAFAPKDSLTEQPPRGSGHQGNRLLHETAEVSWGADDNQRGQFEVILNIGFAVTALGGQVAPGDDEPALDLTFTLGRSITSSILWDTRPGGLRIDNGFIQVHPLDRADSWLMTSRKTVKFTDRTPRSNRAGWADTGQLLNYLAPAALTWWIESEAFSMGSTRYGNDWRENQKARNNGEQAKAT
jgi:hypothetical protein